MLTAQLLDQGTTTKSAFQIADSIDSIGGALGTGAGSDLSYVNAVVMKDSFGLVMDLIADVVRNPAFAPEEIERQRQQALSTLQVSRNDPDYVANVVFDRLVYGFHPYGLPNTGTAESIATVTRQDLQEYHRRYFVPNNMILAIVGDVTSDEAFAAAQRVFGEWARAALPAAMPVDLPQPARRIVVVDKPDAVQTSIRVGQLAIPRKHADYMAWDLALSFGKSDQTHLGSPAGVPMLNPGERAFAGVTIARTLYDAADDLRLVVSWTDDEGDHVEDRPLGGLGALPPRRQA